MNTVKNQLEVIAKTHQELELILHQNNIIIYKFSYLNVFASIEINLGENYPFTLPSIKVIESSNTNIITKAVVPGQFEMETLDTKWDFKLSTVVNEFVTKFKELVNNKVNNNQLVKNQLDNNQLDNNQFDNK